MPGKQGGPPGTLLEKAAETVAEYFGLHYPGERLPDLERGMRDAAQSLNRAPERLMEEVAGSHPGEAVLEALARTLVVGETYFFRDPDLFRTLEEDILPGLIAGRRNAGTRLLRIWSTGCCTGEEPYSIAMLLRRLLPDADSWNLHILATDLNPDFLASAREGIYGSWSLRSTPDTFKNAYLEQVGDKRWRVRPEIRRMVQFSRLNLVRDAYPSSWTGTQSMDLILCRNVLMYLAPGKAEEVVRKLEFSLAEGGMLAISPVESSLVGAFGAFRKSTETPCLLHKHSVVPPFSRTPAFPVGNPPAPAAASAPPAASASASTAASPAAAPAPPGDGGARLAKAFADMKDGAIAEAIALAMEHHKEHPEDTKALEVLAEAYANLGRFDLSLAWCEKARPGRETPDLEYLKANVLLESGDRKGALKTLERILARWPHFVVARFTLGSLLQDEAGPDAARVQFEIALALISALPEGKILVGSDGSLTVGRLRRLILDLMGEGGHG